MSYTSFTQFILESESGGQPTHEELAGLHWFRALQQLGNTLEVFGAEWTTGGLAYSRGNRKLRFSYTEYLFYPDKGTLLRDAYTLKKDLRFNSLRDWDEALFSIWLREVGQRLHLTRYDGLRKAVLNRDGAQYVTALFTQRNDELIGLVRHDPLPDSFLYTVLEQVASPDEIAAIRDLRELGLI